MRQAIVHPLDAWRCVHQHRATPHLERRLDGKDFVAQGSEPCGIGPASGTHVHHSTWRRWDEVLRDPVLVERTHVLVSPDQGIRLDVVTFRAGGRSTLSPTLPQGGGRASYWQASHSGLSIEQNLAPSAAPSPAAPIADMPPDAGTAFNSPPLPVDFSAEVAASVRR